MSPFLDIPHDVFIEILSYLEDRLPTLASLSQTCNVLNQRIAPFLYESCPTCINRDILLSNKDLYARLDSLLRTLSTFNAQFICHLVFNERINVSDDFVTALNGLVNLQHLTIHSTNRGLGPHSVTKFRGNRITTFTLRIVPSEDHLTMFPVTSRDRRSCWRPKIKRAV